MNQDLGLVFVVSSFRRFSVMVPYSKLSWLLVSFQVDDIIVHAETSVLLIRNKSLNYVSKMPRSFQPKVGANQSCGKLSG